jgi:Oxidoreductase molybdopterin binding domain
VPAGTKDGRARLFRRAGRRTNLALLILLVGAFLTGWLAFAAATPPRSSVATIGHGLLGLGLVVLVPWKSVIIRRARLIWIASLGLVAVIVVCLLSGFAQVFGGYRIVANLSPLQVHVGAATVAVPLLIWHVLRHRTRPHPRRVDLSRRNLLRTGAFTLGVGAGYAALEVVGALAGLPSARRISTGSHRLDPLARPATIWLFDKAPALDAEHPVDVAGMLFRPAELSSRSRTVRARLDCTGGWFTDAEWTAVPLSDIIPADRLQSAASLVVTSVTGYSRRFGTHEAGDLWLATGCEGRPLTSATGAPVRLVAPNRRGFWWVKWVASVESSDQPAFAQSPFPLQ